MSFLLQALASSIEINFSGFDFSAAFFAMYYTPFQELAHTSSCQLLSLSLLKMLGLKFIKLPKAAEQQNKHDA
ncbi:MAG: hypothetical protein C4308_01985 [Chitinophagaceae bacterium]